MNGGSRQIRGAAFLAALFCVMGIAATGAPAAAQPPKAASVHPPDPAALLRRMLQAEANRPVSGRAVTFITGGRQSEQVIKRHPKRGVRWEFVRPAGDVLVDNFKRSWYFSPQKRRLVDRESEMADLRRAAGDVSQSIKRGELQARWDGTDVVAGRNAEIVRVSPPAGVDTPSRRFWIDKATGLRLKTEQISPRGRVLSSTYFLSVDLNPTFAADDFGRPPTPPDVKIAREEMESFRTVEAAQKKVGFTIRKPNNLPPGFALRKVSVTRFRHMVIQRYANGLNLLSLFQTDVVEGRAHALGKVDDRNDAGIVPSPRGPGILTWRDKNASFVLIGNLRHDQLRRIADSFHPIPRQIFPGVAQGQ